MTASSTQIVADFIVAREPGSTLVGTPPTRHIDHPQPTVEAEIRLTLDYLAITTPLQYEGGELVRDEGGAVTKVMWCDFHTSSYNRDYDDVGFMGSGQTIHETNETRYGFDSFGNLLKEYRTRSNGGSSHSVLGWQIVKSTDFSRETQFRLMLALIEFRHSLTITT